MRVFAAAIRTSLQNSFSAGPVTLACCRLISSSAKHTIWCSSSPVFVCFIHHGLTSQCSAGMPIASAGLKGSEQSLLSSWVCKDLSLNLVRQYYWPHCLLESDDWDKLEEVSKQGNLLWRNGPTVQLSAAPSLVPYSAETFAEMAASSVLAKASLASTAAVVALCSAIFSLSSAC